MTGVVERAAAVGHIGAERVPRQGHGSWCFYWEIRGCPGWRAKARARRSPPAGAPPEYR